MDVPPPGVGLKMVILAVPAAAISAAVIAAVNRMLLTKVVSRSLLLNLTIDPLTKFVPLTVKAKAALPAVTALGFKLVIAGTGLLLQIPPGY